MSGKDAYTSWLLNLLESKGEIPNSADLQYQGQPVDQSEFLGVLNSLLSKEVVEYEPIVKEVWGLTDEGAAIVEKGSHEVLVFNAVPTGDDGISDADLKTAVGVAFGFGKGEAFKKKWIKKNAAGNYVRAVEKVEDQTKHDLQTIKTTGTHSNAAFLSLAKKKKHVQPQKITTFKVRKGAKFTTKLVQEATDITQEMLASGEWKSATFKKYNFNAEGVQPSSGALHPLMKVREEYRQIFLELGFSEMPTNKYVESSFWNFDALFQPQQHPARDAHDTFFLSDPATSDRLPADYVERVKTVHSTGGYGSIGYGYDWKIEEAQKLVLRTHTTAVSSHMLYQLAQQKEFKPVKWFSIDKVFRNETLDATHLAEFHQIEGVVADRGLTLGDLIGVLHGFFQKLGIKKLRFKPAYNPYTEPSMEIFAWHDGLDKWVEIGNSGMFRPEMLLPLGLPPDVSVIAWGLSTERPTMIKYGINNIRDLVGHKCDLAMINRNPICRLDKD
ncbi:hypothetical protein HK097_009246 [Rhizophlyctis rosea]|uniref:phenylalanine--tRNA ligase n=1 Tax=Rhizophlyctis rosea TaxID=64517 RepID=A0AAD5XAB1_9FUNG|nr:hypothetical protein HK097_009246 [Rhizophlyctis rosea]